MKKSPWKSIFKNLDEAEALPPRKLPSWQLLMTRNHDEVNAEYDRLHPESDVKRRAKAIGERCRIARVLFEELAEDEQEAWRAEAKQSFDEQVAEYTILQGNLRNALPPTRESQERYVCSILTTVSVLIDS